jgi:predicted nucleotidyltransferase
MNSFQKILNSFSVKKTLNPKVWENPEEPNNAVMIPKVRKALEHIADKFIEYLGEDVFVEDIVLTGSLANFNWSEFSDFDLHVIIDLQQYEDDAELYKELYNLKKQVFNDKHDIKIYGYDVELYAQDVEESHYASGVYSVMNNEWVTKPKKFKADVDKEVLENKIKCWTEKIDKAIESDEEKSLDTIKEKLKDYRKSGLEKDGELSYENLVFKFLRRSGHIQKLFDTANKVMDKELSIERKLDDE